MTFEINSIGDAAFLWEILNAVALLTQTDSLGSVVKTGMLVAIFIVVFQAAMDTKAGVQFQKPFLAYLVWMMMFGWTATVNIHDTYAGTDRQVANVPGGIALVGSYISLVGYWLTVEFETMFSTPNMTENGFGRAIDLVLMARSLDIGTIDGALGGGTSASNTLISYLADCTFVGIAKNDIKKDVFLKSANPMVEMKYATNVYGFTSYLNPAKPGGEPLACDTGHATVLAAFAAGGPLMTKIGNMIALKTSRDGTSNSNGYVDLQSSLDKIVGAGKDAQNYMRAAFLKKVIPNAEANKAMQSGSPASAIILTQAIERKRMIEATEGSLFMRTVRPLMTFMEGFVYALTPIMALLVIMGAMGISLVGKYMMMLLWIQLWMPILSIVNLYLNMSVQNKMAALNDINGVNIDPTSILGMATMHSTMADWLSTASSLAAATPALALMLLYGSAVTATSLANKLGDSSTVDPSSASPDLVKQNAAVEMNNTAKYDKLGGLGSTASGIQSINVGASAEKATVGAQQNAVQASETLSSTLSNASASTTNTKTGVTTTQSFGENFNASNTESLAMAKNTMNSIEGSSSWSQEQKDAFTASYAENGGSVGKALNEVTGLKGETGVTWTEADSAKAAESYKNSHSASQMEEDKAAFTHQMQQDVKDSKLMSKEDGWSEEQRETAQTAMSKVSSSSQTYAKSIKQSENVGAKADVNIRNAIGDNNVTDNQVNRAHDILGQDENGAEYKAEQAKFAQEFKKQQIFQGENGDNKAELAAAMYVAAKHGETGMLKDLSEGTNLENDTAKLTGEDYNSDKYKVADTGVEGRVNNRLDQQPTPVAPVKSESIENAEEQVVQAGQRVENGQQAVVNKATQDRNQTAQKAANAVGGQGQKNADGMVNKYLANAGENASTVKKIGESLNKFTEGSQQAITQGAEAVLGAVSAPAMAVSSFLQSMFNGDSFSDAASNAVTAAADSLEGDYHEDLATRMDEADKMGLTRSQAVLYGLSSQSVLDTTGVKPEAIQQAEQAVANELRSQYVSHDENGKELPMTAEQQERFANATGAVISSIESAADKDGTGLEFVNQYNKAAGLDGQGSGSTPSVSNNGDDNGGHRAYTEEERTALQSAHVQDDTKTMLNLNKETLAGEGSDQDKQDAIEQHQTAAVLTMATKLTDNGMDAEQAQELASMEVGRVSKINGNGLNNEIKESAEKGWSADNTVIPKSKNPGSAATTSTGSTGEKPDNDATSTPEADKNVDVPSQPSTIQGAGTGSTGEKPDNDAGSTGEKPDNDATSTPEADKNVDVPSQPSYPSKE